MCDASEHAAGYVLLIEDYTEVNDTNTKAFAPVAFGSKKIHNGTNFTNNVCKGIFISALRLRRVCTQIMGSQETHNSHDRQQGTDSILSGETNSSQIVEPF